MFDSFVFLPLSTRAYFKGRAYIKIILKNHSRFNFAGRSFYRETRYYTTKRSGFDAHSKLCVTSDGNVTLYLNVQLSSVSYIYISLHSIYTN